MLNNNHSHKLNSKEKAFVFLMAFFLTVAGAGAGYGVNELTESSHDKDRIRNTVCAVSIGAFAGLLTAVCGYFGMLRFRSTGRSHSPALLKPNFSSVNRDGYGTVVEPMPEIPAAKNITSADHFQPSIQAIYDALGRGDISTATAIKDDVEKVFRDPNISQMTHLEIDHEEISVQIDDKTSKKKLPECLADINHRLAPGKRFSR